MARNVWAGGYEIDLVVRRGRRLVLCEVKSKDGPRFGDPLEMVDEEKLARITRAAESLLASRPHLAELDVAIEVVAVRGRSVERVAVTG